MGMAKQARCLYDTTLHLVVAAVAHQSKVAIEGISAAAPVRCIGGGSKRGMQQPLARLRAVRADDLAGEINAAHHRLDDGFGGVERQAKAFGREALDALESGSQHLRAVVQQDEIIHITHIPRRAQHVQHELVERVEIHIGKKLAA